VGFAAGERSFSNAAHIQSKLRTRISYEKLHKLLYVYLKSHVLPEEPACTAGHVAAAGGASTDVALETIELDGANDGPVDVEEEELVALRVPAHAAWLARRSLVHRVTRMTCHAPVRTGGAVGAGWDLD